MFIDREANNNNNVLGSIRLSVCLSDLGFAECSKSKSKEGLRIYYMQCILKKVIICMMKM